MVILYEGNRRGFFFVKKKSRRGKIQIVFKLSGKKTITGQNSEELFIKSTEGAIPKL
jgi:hypothetical protein